MWREINHEFYVAPIGLQTESIQAAFLLQEITFQPVKMRPKLVYECPFCIGHIIPTP